MHARLFHYLQCEGRVALGFWGGRCGQLGRLWGPSCAASPRATAASTTSAPHLPRGNPTSAARVGARASDNRMGRGKRVTGTVLSRVTSAQASLLHTRSSREVVRACALCALCACALFSPLFDAPRCRQVQRIANLAHLDFPVGRQRAEDIAADMGSVLQYVHVVSVGVAATLSLSTPCTPLPHWRQVVLGLSSSWLCRRPSRGQIGAAGAEPRSPA